MKKVNSKGFTLIELLAVIVIMGILMLVAIPSVTRVIENSRKDTFVDIAKSYANSAKTLWTADGLVCTVSDESGGTDTIVSSATDNGDYYINIDTKNADSMPTLLETGGKSSWGNRDVVGYVRVNVSTSGSGAASRRITKYYVALTDGTHSVADQGTIESDEITRGMVFMTKDALTTAGHSMPKIVTQGAAGAEVGGTGSLCVES